MANLASALHGKKKPMLNPVQAMGMNSYAMGAAALEAREALRPNTCDVLTVNPTSPWTPVTKNVVTPFTALTLQSGSYLRGIFSNPFDDEFFVINSLKFDTHDLVRTGPVPMSFIVPNLSEHLERILPVIGSKLSSNVSVTGSCTDIDSSDKVFHGIVITSYATDCVPLRSATKPAPGFIGFATLAPAFRGAIKKAASILPMKIPG